MEAAQLQQMKELEANFERNGGFLAQLPNSKIPLRELKPD
jgi:hypothetical protein